MIYDLRMDKKKAKNGFTLIEMVVVVAMMGLMVGLGSVYFSRNSNQRAVDETVSKLISQIEIARNNAKIRNSPRGGAESNFRYVKLEVIDGVAIITNSNGYEYSRTPITSAEVSIDNITGCGLCFAAGEGKLIDSGGGFLTDEVTIAISSGDSAKNVIVNTTGLVQKQVTGSVATNTPIPPPTATGTPTPMGVAINTLTPSPIVIRTPTPVATLPVWTPAPTGTPRPTVAPLPTTQPCPGSCIPIGYTCLGTVVANTYCPLGTVCCLSSSSTY